MLLIALLHVLPPGEKQTGGILSLLLEKISSSSALHLSLLLLLLLCLSLLSSCLPPQSEEEDKTLSFSDVVDEDERTAEGRVRRVFVGWFVDSLAFR